MMRMDRALLVPYLVSHLIAILFAAAAWRWPRVARAFAAAGVTAAGIFNIRTAISSPESYVQGFAPHAIAPYQHFINGFFAEHTAAIVIAIACGQIAVGLLAMAPLPWRKISYIGAIIFLAAISPLGVGSAFPSTLILAAGFAILLYRDT